MIVNTNKTIVVPFVYTPDISGGSNKRLRHKKSFGRWGRAPGAPPGSASGYHVRCIVTHTISKNIDQLR